MNGLAPWVSKFNLHARRSAGLPQVVLAVRYGDGAGEADIGSCGDSRRWKRCVRVANQDGILQRDRRAINVVFTQVEDPNRQCERDIESEVLDVGNFVVTGKIAPWL